MCWGRNNMGQIGTGATSSSESPTVLTLPNNHQAADLAVGANHNCVTTTTSQITAGEMVEIRKLVNIMSLILLQDTMMTLNLQQFLPIGHWKVQ